MNIATVIISLIILSNPAIKIVDIFPDFIGWLLIFNMLKRARFVSGKIDGACANTLRMVWLTLAKFVCILLLPYLDATGELTVTFIFAVLELVWGIPAFIGIFKGVQEMSEMYGGESIYRPIVNARKEGIVVAQCVTYSFFVLKNILTVVPEFLVLAKDDPYIHSEGYRSLDTYQPLFYAVCVPLVLIAAIVWLCTVAPFFKALLKDKKLIDAVREKYIEKVVNTGIQDDYRIKHLLFLFGISGLFMFSVLLDQVNIIPRFIMPIVITFAFAGLKEIGINSSKYVVYSSIVSAISVFSLVLQLYFAVNFGYDTVNILMKAYETYYFVLAFIIVEMLLIVVLEFFVLKTTFLMSKRYAYVITPNEHKKISDNGKIKRTKFRCAISFILFVIVAIVTVLGFLLCDIFPEIWLILLLTDSVWFIYTIGFLSELRADIENKLK